MAGACHPQGEGAAGGGRGGEGNHGENAPKEAGTAWDPVCSRGKYMRECCKRRLLTGEVGFAQKHVARLWLRVNR